MLFIVHVVYSLLQCFPAHPGDNKYLHTDTQRLPFDLLVTSSTFFR